MASAPCRRTASAYPSSPETRPPITVSSVNQPSAAMNALVSGFTTLAESRPITTARARGASVAHRKPAATPSTAVPATTAKATTSAASAG